MRATMTIVVIVLLAGLGWYAYQQFDGRDGVELTPENTNAVDESQVEQPAESTVVVEPEPTQTQSSVGAQSEGEAQVEAAAQLEAEAESFVETLTEVDPEPVAVESADHFVTGEQSIALLTPDIVEETTAEALRADNTLEPNTPITAVKAIEQVESLTPEKLIAESGGNLERTIIVLQNDEPVEVTVKQVLESQATNPEQLISVVKTVRHYQITTPEDLLAELDLTVQGEQLIGIIREPYRLEKATILDLLTQEQLLDPDAIFYVRTVRDTDHQGIWGIVHGGLISNFSRGVAVRRGEEIDTYQVEIPPLADEVLANQQSSYLGRLIYGKTNRSYVYNFLENRMGRNPDELNPGQEIVIIKFSAEELISIYKHFSSIAS